MKQKIVYILGAGFSMNAGAPSQGQLIKEIYKLKTTYRKSSQAQVQKWVDRFDDFLKNTLKVSEEEITNYTLEDIYTPLDKSISENISFRQHTPKELTELRDIFNLKTINFFRNA